MTNQRFTLHINWYNYEKTEGEAELKDNGQPILISEDVEDMRRLKELLNELNDENKQLKFQLKECREHKLFSRRQIEQENKELKHYNEAYADEIVNIKHTIKTMMKNERTEIGKNTLKQLWEAIQ